MRRFTLVAAFAAAGLSASCGIAGQRPEGYEKRDYVVDPSLRYRPITLGDIVRNPQERTPVEFEAMLNRRDESVWQAYYTPFKPGEFKSFSVWPADAAVWDVRGRARSIPTLYIEGDSPEIAELYSISRYTPVRIRGVVLSSFDSRPWVQVNYIEEIGAPWFTDESLGHLIRGLDAARTNPKKAIDLLEDALDGPLSPAGQAAAYKAMGWCHLGAKKYKDAEQCYVRALEAMPGDRAAADGLERARHKAAPGEWSDEPASKDDSAPSVNWKDMYSNLFTEHESRCKQLAEDHAKCAEMTQALTAERDAAVKASAESGASGEGMKKQLEEKDAAIKAATDKSAGLEAELKTAGEKATALEAERDDLKKKMEGGGAEMEGAKKQLEEKDAALKAANEKVTALETERDELKKKVEGGGADAESAKKAMEEKDAALKTANEKVTALETERDELKKKLEADGGGDEATKKQLEASKTKIGELEQQMKDRDDTIKKQREEIDRLTEELKKKEGGN
jgi:tetratricopeptide (TPR) repeat protein